MKAIRPGPRNRGPFTGTEPNVFLLYQFPAEIWVTSAVQKRKNLERYIVSRYILGEPVRATAAPVQPKPKATKVLLQVKYRKAIERRIKTELTFTKVYGRPTTKPGVKGPRVESLVNLKRSKPLVKVQFIKPVKSTVVIVQGKVKEILLVSVASTARKKSKGRVVFSKVYGRSTAKTIPKAPRTLSFVAQLAERKARYVPVRIVLNGPTKVVSGTPGSVVVVFDGLWVADGLTYHKTLSRPTLTITPNPNGGSDVVITGSLSEIDPAILNKKTVTIDGELP